VNAALGNVIIIKEEENKSNKKCARFTIFRFGPVLVNKRGLARPSQNQRL
jgi:hypothetical protein